MVIVHGCLIFSKDWRIPKTQKTCVFLGKEFHFIWKIFIEPAFGLLVKLIKRKFPLGVHSGLKM